MENPNARDPVPDTSGGDTVHMVRQEVGIEELRLWAAEHGASIIECGEDLNGYRICFARHRESTRVAKIPPERHPRWYVGFQT
ncbi:hypothetical protein O4J56_00195 [Nocardiopsis sp. RSe5-2]|uniref:Uncharacterized protein n=1 Tax=Nocardiopsis endophytica TaxID=3018445 RepID=A0ABT4TWG9_9ACTN|nr:hypothetical protein [Nocardiopsis endophytica]MDA2809049.1 hypothetical protein [Nocardiopsis endophytica]